MIDSFFLSVAGQSSRHDFGEYLSLIKYGISDTTYHHTVCFIDDSLGSPEPTASTKSLPRNSMSSLLEHHPFLRYSPPAPSSWRDKREEQDKTAYRGKRDKAGERNKTEGRTRDNGGMRRDGGMRQDKGERDETEGNETRWRGTRRCRGGRLDSTRGEWCRPILYM